MNPTYILMEDGTKSNDDNAALNNPTLSSKMKEELAKK